MTLEKKCLPRKFHANTKSGTMKLMECNSEQIKSFKAAQLVRVADSSPKVVGSNFTAIQKLFSSVYKVSWAPLCHQHRTITSSPLHAAP